MSKLAGASIVRSIDKKIRWNVIGMSLIRLRQAVVTPGCPCHSHLCGCEWWQLADQSEQRRLGREASVAYQQGSGGRLPGTVNRHRPSLLALSLGVTAVGPVLLWQGGELRVCYLPLEMALKRPSVPAVPRGCVWMSAVSIRPLSAVTGGGLDGK